MSFPYNIFVPGKGNPYSKIAIVGEAPFYEECENLTPFVGSSGKFLNQLLGQVGINRDECWVTNVCKYFVPPSPKEGKQIPFSVRAKNVGINLEEQIDSLRRELLQINPNVIIALGGTALWALTGKKPIKSWRGSIIQGFGKKVVATYHPAHILHQEGEVKGYWNKQVMLFDLKRALYQSSFADFRLPRRTLRVCKSSYDLDEYIRRYPSGKLSVDIEAHKCIPCCIGIANNSHEGLTIPLWNVNGVSDLSDNELTRIWIRLSNFIGNSTVVGQNFGYDRDKIRRLGFTIGKLVDDTMFKAFCINPELPKNLAFNTSIYTEEPYYKDEGMYEGSIEDLLIGCARDACVTYEVNEKMDVDLDEIGMRDYYEKFMMPLHDLYLKIENNGFRVNDEFRKEILRKYVEWDVKLDYTIFKIARRPINVNSNGQNGQVGKLLFEDFKLPLRKGVGEEVLTQLLNNTVKQEHHKIAIESILEARRVKKTINSYLLSPADYDGRMRTSYFLCLETGRSSTSQQEPPIRPVVEYKDKGEKKKQARGMAFQTITKHGDIGADIRRMFIPDEGEIFLQADSSQAEARVIFLLAGEDLGLFDEHDLHALTASWFFGGTESDYSKKVLGYESPLRFVGKTLRHAGHLGQSKRGAAISVNTDARKYKIQYKISEAAAGKALEIFHKRQPRIKGVFHAEIIRCLEQTRRITAPVPYGIDAKIGGTRTFFERWGEELFRQAFSYIPQRTVSENTKGAALRIDKNHAWIKILVESHDALLVSVKEERKHEAALILKTELERPIDFSTCSLPRGELIIPCEVEEGYNYKDLSKFKWQVEHALEK